MMHVSALLAAFLFGTALAGPIEARQEPQPDAASGNDSPVVKACGLPNAFWAKGCYKRFERCASRIDTSDEQEIQECMRLENLAETICGAYQTKAGACFASVGQCARKGDATDEQKARDCVKASEENMKLRIEEACGQPGQAWAKGCYETFDKCANRVRASNEKEMQACRDAENLRQKVCGLGGSAADECGKAYDKCLAEAGSAADEAKLRECVRRKPEGKPTEAANAKPEGTPAEAAAAVKPDDKQQSGPASAAPGVSCPAGDKAHPPAA